ncbi:hypothetical protein F5146DRAFT_1164458 [Armillaria mellea]|nr:hypothetical protein F5146DRAFT_1164458 [Armillaria mellea]
MALDQVKLFFRQEHNRSIPYPLTLLNGNGDLTCGSELSFASYGTETVNPNDPKQIVYDLYTHETSSTDEGHKIPCTETYSNFHPIGTVHVTTVPVHLPVINSSDISTDIQHKYPTPLWDVHKYYVPIEAAYTTSLGVSMNQILHGSGSCLQYPDQYPKALAGLPFIDVVFHSNGYLPQYIRIAAKCSHVTGMRYIDVAYGVAHGYRTILRREASKISPSRTDKDLPLVTDVKYLKLVGLYSRDKRVWWAEVAICGPPRRH